MQINDNRATMIYNFIPQRIIARSRDLSSVFNLYETYFKLTSLANIKEKYTIIKLIIQNEFMNEKERAKLLEIISENQKLYLILCRINNKYKFLKSKTYDNDYDLHGENLSEIPSEQKITIFHENMKYVFKLTNLVSIINHSLSKCEEFFVESEPIKNPYTNIAFNISILYNIYFTIKRTCINMPILFEMYFKCGFCIHKFKTTYEPYILDEYIKSYFKDLTQNKLCTLCYEILQKYKRASRKLREFNFHRRYPKDTMVKKMKPIIQKYLFVKHSQNQGYRFECERTIIRDLGTLITNDKEFGKPVIKKTKRTGTHVVFETLKHLNKFRFDPFYEQIINPLDDFKANDYKFVEETFDFAPPVICDRVDEDFLQRMSTINRHRERQDTERERIISQISRRRTEIDNIRNTIDYTNDVSGNRVNDSQSIYTLINEIMDDYVDERLVAVGRQTVNSVHRRIDINAVRDAETTSMASQITGTNGRARGRYINEDNPNETLANQVVAEDNISESGSINNELEDGEIIDDDDATDPDMPELIHEEDDEEDIFAIDYDTIENTITSSNWVTRSPYNDIENSFITSESNNYAVNNDDNVTFRFNVRVPEMIGSIGIPTVYEDDDEDTEEDEGYGSF